jgi:hypothetical protein
MGKIILSLLLGLYSLGLITYTLSEVFLAEGACTNCYGKETAFAGGKGPNGEASTPSNRYVNVGYDNSGGANTFTGSDATKIASAISTASDAWNGAKGEDNTSEVPYTFIPSQNGNKVNVKISLVDKVPGDKDGGSCGGFKVDIVGGEIKGGTIYILKSTMQGQTADQIAKIVEHELGHFMGLANIDLSRMNMCESIMDRSTGDGCALNRSISKGDVSTVIKHADNNQGCKRDRKSKVDRVEGGGGGYTDPTPIWYYPPTCYYFYDAVDYYYCYEGCRYIGTVYYLTDVFCY